MERRLSGQEVKPRRLRAEFTRLAVPLPVTSSNEALRIDIDFSPLRGFPRWEALLPDPANKQPFK